jgi:WD40 repeat protein
VASLAFAPTGGLLASAGHDTTVRFWDGVTGNSLRSPLGVGQFPAALAFSPSGKLLAVGDNDKGLSLLAVPSGSKVRDLIGHTAAVWAVAFAPDGRTVASASNDQTVRLWEVPTGGERWQRKVPAEAVAFSPDGRLLATAYSKYVRLWDARTGKDFCLRELHPTWIRAVEFSPDGRLLATASQDTTVLLWDVASLLAAEKERRETTWMRMPNS